MPNTSKEEKKMPLTEEQRARMEANKLKALAKRTVNNGLAAAKVTPPQPTMIVTKTTTANLILKNSSSTSSRSVVVAPPPSRAATAKTFYPSSKKPALKGQAVMATRTRFLVRIGFHDRVVSVFKTIGSAQYLSQDRLWTFGLADHDELMKKLSPLRPEVCVEGLPRFVLRVFEQGEAPPVAQEEVSLRSRIEPTLFDSLMPFQREGIEFSFSKKGRVLLADDMGLGKTLQALGVASAYRSKWPLLIVCPSSVRFSWKDAVVRWLPSVPEEDIAVITTGKDNWDNCKVIIISYDLITRKEKTLIEKNFHVAIVDESHFLKSRTSQRLQSSEKVLKRTEHLILLSGTPALSRPIELYSQLSLLLPKLFPYATDYGMRYCDGKKISYGGRGSHFDFSGASNMDELRLLMEETCLIRRLKSEVLSQLPAKQRQMIILDPATVKNSTKEMKEQAARMGLKSLSSMERRGVLLEWYNLTGISKAKAVLDYLSDLLESDKKFICFAHHQSMMNEIGALLEKEKVRYIRIDGRTPSEARNQHCEQFQNDEKTRVALLSITAANAGITLTEAQIVVFAELFWNPGILTQAEDRAHRIGRTGSGVIVQYLVAKGTADDELWPLLQRKLNVLNEAGLSKDNFQDSDASYAKTSKNSDEQSSRTPSKITDYFSSSLLADLDLDAWDADDSFGTDQDEGTEEASKPKKCKGDK